MSKFYPCIGLGGTFDHLHKGHREFILFANQLSEKLIIGVTDHAMIAHKLYAQSIQPLEQRVLAVKRFCQQHEIIADVVILHDVFGPTITSDEVFALAVTEETVEGGQKINLKRQSIGLPVLPVHVFPLVPDDQGKPITSTRIRAGEIDEEGSVFRALLENGIRLNEAQRLFFSLPQGEIVSKAPTVATQPTFVVGDVCLQNFHDNGWEFHAGWFDGKTERNTVTSQRWSVDFEVHNPAGFLTQEATYSIQSILNIVCDDWGTGHLPNNQQIVHVQGEEDLITIGLVLLAPLASIVYYGQPNMGMVAIEVSGLIKSKFLHALTNTHS